MELWAVVDPYLEGHARKLRHRTYIEVSRLEGFPGVGVDHVTPSGEVDSLVEATGVASEVVAEIGV